MAHWPLLSELEQHVSAQAPFAQTPERHAEGPVHFAPPMPVPRAVLRPSQAGGTQ